MTTVTDSLLDIGLPLEPELGDGSKEDLKLVLQDIHNAIQILTNEVERIRIATGTSAPC